MRGYYHHSPRQSHRQASPPQIGVTDLAPRLEKVSKENLDEKSKNFIKSLTEYYAKNGRVTQGQFKWFESIESRFSPAEKEKLANWAEEYKTKHLADAKILAEYYTQTGYYRTMAGAILSDPNFVPPRASFEKMRGSKYAQKVLAAVKDDAKFAVNAMVQVRGTAGPDWQMKKFRHRLCFVLSNTAPIVSAVNGGKRYKVLPMGHSEPIFLEERHIMKPNKKGKSN